MESESRLVVARACGEEGMGRDCFMGARFPFGGDENVLELDSGNGYTTL